jgi:pimeloyl-ACP methyl ester carboxylesterase
MGAAQWRGVARNLKETHRCVAPNLRGYGRTTSWPIGRPADIAAELAVLDAVAARLAPPFHVVGHSMGAWLALEWARRAPGRCATVTIIEPVVLGLLHARGEEGNLADVAAMIEDVLAAFARADVAAAAGRFTDYWYGAGAWARIPLAQRLPIFARADKMRSDIQAVWADRSAAATFAGLRVPALVLSAENTTPAASRMAEILAATIPAARRDTIAGAGHMAPLTDAAACAAHLRRFYATGTRGA